MRPPTAVIVGAGLAGSLLAIYLARRGMRVEVFERRSDMRRGGAGGGRSINLALSLRGIHALEQVGVADAILDDAIPMQGRMIHSPDGTQTLQPYSPRSGEVINSVSRGGLNMLLMDRAEAFPEVTLHFGQRCQEVDLDGPAVTFCDESDGTVRTVSPEVLFGCDGSGSAVRMAMQQRGRFNFSQHYLEHGYKEVTIPPGAGGTFQMETHALHIWPRGHYMLIALPNPDGSFTGTLFLPYGGDPGFDGLDSDDAVTDFFRLDFGDVLPLMPELAAEFAANPTGSLVTVRCEPWHSGGRVLLVGDSAHAIVPFYGQGMNCAFEDVVELDACIERHGPDWTAVFADYAARRKPNADAIADLALENFIEMRDRVADPVFVRKRQAELAMERRFPERFRSKYSLVTFSRRPYAEALQRGRLQDEILMEMCGVVDTLADLDLEMALERIEAALAERGWTDA